MYPKKREAIYIAWIRPTRFSGRFLRTTGFMLSGPPALLFPKLDIASRTFARLTYIIFFWASANFPKYGFPFSLLTRVVFPGKWMSIRWSAVPSGVSTGASLRRLMLRLSLPCMVLMSCVIALESLVSSVKSFQDSHLALLTPFRKTCLLFRYPNFICVILRVFTPVPPCQPS